VLLRDDSCSFVDRLLSIEKADPRIDTNEHESSRSGTEKIPYVKLIVQVHLKHGSDSSGCGSAALCNLRIKLTVARARSSQLPGAAVAAALRARLRKGQALTTQTRIAK